MQVSKKGISLIKKFEGCRLLAYQDSVGVWTIGYGHTRGISRNDKISQEQADTFLLHDIELAVKDVNRLVKVTLNSNQFDALVSFTFNLGARNLSSSTLLKKLNAGQTDMAANEFGRWIFAGERISSGLVKRREAEKNLFLS